MPVTVAAMETILDYAYIGRMTLNEGNVVEVLNAIDYFSMIQLLHLCADFVLAHAMTTDNVIKLRAIFVCAGLYAHAEYANNFIKVIFHFSFRYFVDF